MYFRKILDGFSMGNQVYFFFNFVKSIINNVLGIMFIFKT